MPLPLNHVISVCVLMEIKKVSCLAVKKTNKNNCSCLFLTISEIRFCVPCLFHACFMSNQWARPELCDFSGDGQKYIGLRLVL
jgi:hypothetical protein